MVKLSETPKKLFHKNRNKTLGSSRWLEPVIIFSTRKKHALGIEVPNESLRVKKKHYTYVCNIYRAHQSGHIFHFPNLVGILSQPRLTQDYNSES